MQMILNVLSNTQGDRSFIRFRFMVYDPKYDIVKNQRRSSSPPAPARTSLTSLSQEPQHLPRHHLRPHGHGALLQRHALRRLQNHARAEAAGKTGHGQCQGPGVDRPVELSREGVRRRTRRASSTSELEAGHGDAVQGTQHQVPAGHHLPARAAARRPGRRRHRVPTDQMHDPPGQEIWVLASS
jgi:hypothetical protein